MTSVKYTTIEDFQSIVANKIGESVSLEYKASKILADRKISDICKAVTALANSVGGYFLIGIASKNQSPESLDGGLADDSRSDWIHQIINAHTHPPVEGVEITQLHEMTGSYYAIHVPQSPKAPHQSDDHKYYKRRGSHSEPMEHYEIEDVRNRPKKEIAPLRVELVAERQLAYLHLRNDDAHNNLENIQCTIIANFDLKRDGLTALGVRGLRQLRPNAELFFLLDSFYTILNRVVEPELTIETSYVFRGVASKHTTSFYLADYHHSSVMQSVAAEKLEDLGKKVEGISNALRDLGKDVKKLASISDATGLRISQRTLSELRLQSVRYDPSEFDWQGYKMMLDVATDDAIQLYHIFHTFGSVEDKRKSFAALPPELTEKFRARFNIPFE